MVMRHLYYLLISPPGPSIYKKRKNAKLECKNIYRKKEKTQAILQSVLQKIVPKKYQQLIY
ncbi:hypothetical protein C4J81_12480 [Deltaproteobacteria bacterium Smac51]|nr:hypothetical protein C4J81_12480 [Deltaproteobacteria bacterium Smac51]